MTRKQIESRIEKNNQKIKLIEQSNRNLFLQSLEISDKRQWYTEEDKILSIKKGGKTIKENCIIGFINWKEDFECQETGKKISIERQQAVKRNGIWIV